MTKRTKCGISIFLILFFIAPAFGYPGMDINTSGAASDPENITQLDIIDPENTTESDQGIVLLQQLIEVDLVQLELGNNIFVRETLIYRNEGPKNFSGSLRVWVPDGATGIRIARVEMMMDGGFRPIQPVQDGNIVSWEDFIIARDPLPPLYVVEYVLPAFAGKGGDMKTYSKMLVYPTLVTKQPFSVILKVVRSNGELITITDERGNSISSSGNPREEDNSVLYDWEGPMFRELHVSISGPGVSLSQIAGYAFLGFVIVLVLLYPTLRRKSETLREIEGKIKTSLRREPREEEVGGKPSEVSEEEVSEPEEHEPLGETKEEPGEPELLGETKEEPEEPELLGKTKEEMENEKEELLSKLSELEKDYASGNLLDEEYEELSRSYQEKVEKITRKIERL